MLNPVQNRLTCMVFEFCFVESSKLKAAQEMVYEQTWSRNRHGRGTDMV